MVGRAGGIRLRGGAMQAAHAGVLSLYTSFISPISRCIPAAMEIGDRYVDAIMSRPFSLTTHGRKIRIQPAPWKQLQPLFQRR